MVNIMEFIKALKQIGSIVERAKQNLKTFEELMRCYQNISLWILYNVDDPDERYILQEYTHKQLFILN